MQAASQGVRWVADALLSPPGSVLVLLGLGWLLGRRWRRLGLALIGLAVGMLYVLSTPLVGTALLASLEVYPALRPDEIHRERAAVIVVLGSGRYRNAPEYGDDTVSPRELVRLRYAARLYRKTGLPILLSGGGNGDEDYSEAFLMKEALVDDFRVPVQWTEEHSRNTQENAAFTAKILTEEGIRRLYLVAHAWDMRRAVAAFHRVGLDPIPAPTGFVRPGPAPARAVDLLPRAWALGYSAFAVHEYVGLLWYRWRYDRGA